MDAGFASVLAPQVAKKISRCYVLLSGKDRPAVKAMHDSRLIANKFIEKASENANAFSPMQLLKLVYIAHGWMLGLYGIPLTRDRIEAWKFGPVIPSLYHATKHCGDRHVIGQLPVDENDELLGVEIDLIGQIYDIYGKHSGIALSNLTHKQDTPWDRVYVPGRSHIPISNDIIEEHYKALAERLPE
ncbi:MAG: type II toxin-antitoxin system antitoxin SocA domain-containing protein [Pseudomonadota bacterium]